MDTKFALPISALPNVLREMSQGYAVVLAGESRAADYRTLYFDSTDHVFFREHCRGRRPRFKVRVRHYIDRKLSYLEIKEKTPNNQTIKARRALPFMETALGSEENRFIDAHNPVASLNLSPSLWTNFRRITLVGEYVEERVTI